MDPFNPSDTPAVAAARLEVWATQARLVTALKEANEAHDRLYQAQQVKVANP